VPLPDNNRIFSTIAPRYDLLNHLLSFNIDKRWRIDLVKLAGLKSGERVLDVCTGTGDLAIRFAHDHPENKIVGIDLSEEMLHIARRKVRSSRVDGSIRLLEADALSLPFANDSFEVVSIGFGLRNIAHHKKGISEMTRILKEGGRLVILEFSPPQRSLFGGMYRFYLNTIIRAIGGIISGSAEAYRHLSTSITSFPQPEEIVKLMEEEKLKDTCCRSLTGGIAYIYRGEK
jgi:demethylmenaquinone methyltransferase/2-methoxy-6-polyprenyl-1,4-benzoquinol methylase